MSQSASKNATRTLVAFLRSYTDLQLKHLQGIHVTMRETVDGVMQGIQQISDRTAISKKKANDAILSNAAAGAPAGMDEPAAAQSPTPADGRDSKHMEALNTLDSELQELLASMMGQLSRDDIISQRIEHLMMALQAMQTTLTVLLSDFDGQCQDAAIDKLVDGLKTAALRTYTMEEERKTFFEVFPEARRKAS